MLVECAARKSLTIATLELAVQRMRLRSEDAGDAQQCGRNGDRNAHTRLSTRRRATAGHRLSKAHRPLHLRSAVELRATRKSALHAKVADARSRRADNTRRLLLEFARLGPPKYRRRRARFGRLFVERVERRRYASRRL